MTTAALTWTFENIVVQFPRALGIASRISSRAIYYALVEHKSVLNLL